MGKIKFQKFLSVFLTHDYYKDNLCKDFEIIPSASTSQILKDFGILFKPHNSGAIFINEVVTDNGVDAPKFPIIGQYKLQLYFVLKNNYFQSFTDLEFSSKPVSIYYFNNLTPSISGQDYTISDSKLDEPIEFKNSNFKVEKATQNVVRIVLKGENSLSFEFPFKSTESNLEIDISVLPTGKYTLNQYNIGDSIVNTSEVYIDTQQLTRAVFAVFEVFIDETNNGALPVNYLFNFKSREVYWRYKLVKKVGSSINGSSSVTPVIVHGDTGPSKIVFDPPVGSDPIIYITTSAIKLKQSGIKNIQLKKGNNVVVSDLPNASVFTLGIDNNKWYSDIYVYYYE